MKRQARTRTGPRRLSLLLGLGATVLLALALTPTTEAGRKHKKHKWKHDHRHVSYHAQPVRCAAPGCRVTWARHEVVVPRRISRRHVDLYRPYFAGEVYYRPHRHDHAVYYFPVRTRRGIAWEARYYCRGELLPGGHVAYHGRNVSFRVHF